jgi:hypothetical protein
MIVTDASQCHEEAGNYIKAEALAIEVMREMALKDWDLRRNHKLLLGRKKGEKLCNNQPLTASSTRYWPRSMQ